MAKFSNTSLQKLNTCHPDIVLIMSEAIKIADFTILEGSRPDELQYKYFKEGKSKLDGIKQKSKHQVTKQNPLSMAVEIEVGHNFNTFNFAGQKITFILDPQKDDDKPF